MEDQHRPGRRTDVTCRDISSGTTWALDVSVADPQKGFPHSNAATVIGSAAATRESEKTTNYAAALRDRPDVKLFPLVIETFGCFGTSFNIFLRQCSRRGASQVRDLSGATDSLPYHKLLPRTQWGINLGTCPVSKGWVIKDVVSGKVTITRDVIFYEEVSYLQWKGVEKEIAAAGTATTSDKVEDLLEEKESEGVGDEKDEEIEDVERADSVDWVWEKAPAREADENKGVEIAGEQPSKEVAEGVNDEVAREERDEESAAEGSSDPWKFLNSGDNQAAEKEIEDLLEEGAIVIGREVKDGEGKALTDSSEEEVESSAEELGKGKRVKKPNPRYAQLLMTCWKDIHTHLLLSASCAFGVSVLCLCVQGPLCATSSMWR
ncbi:unnamed protein product [Closterium sp. Yama58-4]|nr:unnamed protein product [Closterium sp. Yama58-4]